MKMRKLVKAGAYVKSPAKTFTVLHPWKAAKLLILFWIAKQLFATNHRRGRPRLRHLG